MAHILTPKDAHTIMNLLVRQATGQTDVSVVDTSSFVSAGETVLATGTENSLNALSMVIGRTMAASRPYKAKLILLRALNTGAYTSRLRKISYYSKDSLAAGHYNTDLFTNFANSYDNGTNGGQSTSSMWVQDAPIPLEVNFSGSSVWQDELTTYDFQLKQAFRNETEFNAFWSGIVTEKQNDIESQKEAFSRMTLLNAIAGTYALSASMPGSVINLKETFNTKYGTTYTVAELTSTYLKEFLAHFVEQFKLASDRMTNRTKSFHWSPAKQVGDASYSILRQTPKSMQRSILYSPLFISAEANVLPQIFNPQYLDVKSTEMVEYWQSFNNPSAINITPAIPNVSNPATQTVGSNVSLGFVVGILYDVEAMMVDMQLETAATTPLEARKHYRNTWFSYSKNAINDFTENRVIFILED